MGELKEFFGLFVLGAAIGFSLILVRFPVRFVKKGGRVFGIICDLFFSAALTAILPEALEIICSGRLCWHTFPSIAAGFVPIVVFLPKALDRICGFAYNISKKREKGVRDA